MRRLASEARARNLPCLRCKSGVRAAKRRLYLIPPIRRNHIAIVPGRRARLATSEQGAKMAAETKYQGVYPQLVTKIIASYVSHHNVSPEQIPELISSVHRTIDGLGKPVEPQGALT